MAETTQKKIYITSYDTEQAKRCENEMLRLWSISHQDKYLLTPDISSADLILIGLPGNESSFEEYSAIIKRHPVISRFLAKSFSVSMYRAQPLFLHKGVYESAQNSFFKKNRIVAGAYATNSFNPIISELIEGNRPVSVKPKEYLFSFIGRNSHPCRERMFRMLDASSSAYIRDSSSFDAWNSNHDANHLMFKKYLDVLLRSKFSLCPRGWGPGSIRLFESMSMGIAPVIISDDWKLPEGPDWGQFSIRIRERDVGNIENILQKYEPKHKIMGQKAKEAYDEFFSPFSYFNYLVENCLRIQRLQKVPEGFFWKLRFIKVFAARQRFMMKRLRRTLLKEVKKIYFRFNSTLFRG